MRALVFERTGDPAAVLKLADVADPTPAHGQALVQVTHRPIHPADLAFIRGQYRVAPRPPQVAGLEGAGVVLQSVEGSPFRAGTRVAFRWPGTWAERAAVPVNRLVEVPRDVSDEVACQICLNPLTAWALLDEARLAAEDWLLLTAAASTVSGLAAAMAAERAIRTIGIVRNTPKERPPGIPLLSTADPNLANDISRLTGKRGVGALLDSVGGPLLPTLFSTLRPGARIVAYGVQDREPSRITNAMLIYSNLTWIGFGIDRWLARFTPDEVRELFGGLWSMVRNGVIALPVASRHGLEHIDAALRADRETPRNGKVLLV